jgi:hypothetical protein
MRPRGRRDKNQGEVVAALRAAGASVIDLAGVGRGCPDLAIGYNGVTLFLEVKSPGGRLTPDQEAWFSQWRGRAVVIRSAGEALALIERMGV